MNSKTLIVCGLFSISFLFACTPNNVKSDAAIEPILEKEGLKGSFALLENGTESFIIHNLSAYKDSAIAPLNTFFLIPTLIAIDKGYIQTNPQTWLSTDAASSYHELIKKIGRASLIEAIDSLHYGKGLISADSTNFWNNNSLRITADEQLGFIKKLYFNQLYFQKRSQDLLKKMLLKEDNANYKLSYIATSDTTKNNASWVLGYIEENKHPYFFVLSTTATSSADLLNKNIRTMKAILTQQGFFKGTR
jgi:beta-lactamase class D